MPPVIALWWTVAVDEGAGDGSPWARDDWMPERPEPIAFPTPSRDDGAAMPPRAEPDAAHPSPSGPAWWTGAVGQVHGTVDGAPQQRRVGPRGWLSVGALAVGVLAVVAFALQRGDEGDDASDPADSTIGTATPTEPSEPDETPASTEPRRSTAPTIAVRPVTPDGAETTGVVSLVTERPDTARLELGRVPPWTEWELPLVAPLDTFTEPTEIVVVGPAGIHRLELPSGRVRSLDVDVRYTSGGWMAVSGGTVALVAGDEVLLLPTDAPALVLEFGPIAALTARPEHGDFLVEVSPERGSPDTDLVVVSATGEILSMSPWTRTWNAFTPSLGEVTTTPEGELVMTAPGGVYAIDPRGGEPPRRISAGAVVGVGANHVLVEQCDEHLECAIELLDLRSGEISPVVVDVTSAPYWPSRVSPNGHFVATMMPRDGNSSVGWRIVDLTTGEERVSDNFDAWLGVHSWTADGFGLVYVDGRSGTLAVRDVNGRHVEIVGLGALYQVEVHQAVTWPKRLEPAD